MNPGRLLVVIIFLYSRKKIDTARLPERADKGIAAAAAAEMPADRGGDGGDASGGVRVSSIGLPRSLQDRGPGHYPHSPFLRRGFLPRVDADEYAYAIARRRKNGMLAVAAAGEEDLVGVSRWQCSA